MLSDEQKEAIRNKVTADHARMQDAMAPFYLGRLCWRDFKECRGMECTAFVMQANEKGAVVSGACGPILASTVIGPIADGLMQLAAANVSNVPRVIGSVGGH